MKPSKPRVVVEIQTTSAMLRWDAIENATAYQVSYQENPYIGHGSSTITHTVSSTSVNITQLCPNTTYTASVCSISFGRRSNNTTIYFTTKNVEVMSNIGAGESLFPSYPLNTKSGFKLIASDLGHSYDTTNPALFIDGSMYQFATFEAGQIYERTHVQIKLMTTSGTWSTSLDKSRYLDSTILQVMVISSPQRSTNWMDANRLRVAGVEDIHHGARVFDGVENRASWNIPRVSFGRQAISGCLIVRIGLCDDNRCISGIMICT